ncbi:ATP-binding protein [Aquabacterium sp.]|uniref:ATP-binding protein n=1 Tax=Aquabacterium sp. TaxID=1872578 RepID=UPI00199D52AF|nr:ATP-binding protein [Aquabacterium sp.]MBC7699587.1 response regulator [Aquabacterium sp.]
MNRNDQPASDSDPQAFLKGGGEMGGLIRSMDWSMTSLGPVVQWSQSLRTTVSICLASDLPICIIWGPGLVQLYNDGYRLICGDKHPRSMGQNFPDCWKEAWPVIGEAHDSALAGNTAFLETQHIFLERYGYLEECFFTFSFSPIRGETGLVGGLFHPVIEMTSKVISERRTRALRDLAARTSKAKTVDEALALSAQTLSEYDLDLPFVLLYALEPDGHQARLVGTTGLKPNGAASRSTVDLDVPEQAVWPLSEVVRSGTAVQVDQVGQRVGPGFVGPYPEPPTAALVLPIIPPGATRAAAVFIAGVSSRLPMSEAYRSFYDLVASGITTAVANARGHEEERRRSEALAELDRAKTAFFSNVSHEFRTPLTLILGQVENLLAHSRTDLTPNAAAQLEVVNRNGMRLLRLVNSLLDFSRIEAGRARAAYQPVDLAAFTAELASVFRSAVERAGLALTVDCPPLDQPVYVDREMWEKVVLNLLSNAFKFTFEGEIAVTLRQVGRAAELVVRDTGTGIPAAEIPRLFERFHRVENARGRTHEGSGIGLALVQELVKLHGGAITAESEFDRGTTFRVSIPLGTEHLPREQLGGGDVAAQPKTEASPFVQEALRWLPEGDPPHAPGAELPSPEDLLASASLSPRIDANRPLVLVADDNLDMRQYLERLLKGQYHVEAVPDGEAALAAVRRQLPDLILTDVMMPRLDGFGLLKALRADPRTADVPVILLSARAGEESRIEGMEAGADDYVVKPFSVRELVARIDAQVLRQRLRAAERLQADRLTEVFAQTPVGIAVLRGNEHRFEFVNDAYLQLLDGRAIQGLPIREALPELAGQGIYELLDNCLVTGEVFQARSMRLMVDDGSGTRKERFFDLVYQPTLGPDERAVGVVVVAYDVSKLTEARREADRANRAKDEFLAMLGHELRNPLSPITTTLHVMRMKSPQVFQVERALLERQVGHLVRLVDDLLDVSRIASGKMELRLASMDLRTAVAIGVETASPALERQQHRLLLELDNQPLWIMGDAARLAQVVSNLLVNASKFTPPNGKIQVHVHRASNNQAVIKIIDNGVGISEEMLSQVFDIFTQERQSVDRASGGLGLGLAIVKSLVRSHGGEVVARSQGIGKGSTFKISIPLMAGDEDSGTTDHCLPALFTKMSGRVLVVDDNQDAAETLAHALAASGLQIQTAPDGPSALELAKSFQPDFAILDIGLPVMDGYELAKLLKIAHPSLIRIALTGYGAKSDAVEGKCFEARMLKPVDLPALLSLLELLRN